MHKFTNVLFLLFISNVTLSAQQTSNDYSENAVYAELGGAGIIYSINYDHRITENISVRAGANYAPTLIAPGVGFIGQGSYLFGKDAEFFELSLGITYVITDDPNIVPFSGDKSIKGTIINSFVGYRNQSLENPVFFRIGLTPFYSLFSDDFFWSAGLSFGYSF